MSFHGRREKILELVAEVGFATVEELGGRFEVSQMTVRRDLQSLEDEGLLRRTHGGATVGNRAGERGFAERSAEALPEKRAIGRVAAGLVEDGQTIVLDAGTTALEVARQLTGKKEITVITSSMRVLDALSHSPHIQVIATGGFLKQRELAMVGPLTENMLAERRADIAFISASGFSVEDGATDYEDFEVAVKQMMIRRSKLRFLVADSTKIDKVTPLVIAPANAFNGLITDSAVSSAFAERMREANLQLIVATPAMALSSTMAS